MRTSPKIMVSNEQMKTKKELLECELVSLWKVCYGLSLPQILMLKL